MDVELSWIFLGLPLAFVLGWLASRLDLRQLRLENRHNPKAYFKGLNHLLNEQQDQAIDAFIEAVQRDPDTSELHFALGNLFRRRGEFERAVRVHQHLLGRDDLSETDRQRAQHALALDYLKAGILDRAETALRALLGTPLSAQAELALLNIYERTREWAHAVEMAERLDHAEQGSFAVRQSHYLCEQAQALLGHDAPQAQALLLRALEIAPRSPRAHVQLAQLQYNQGQGALALESLLKLRDQAPAFVSLVTPLLLQLAREPAGRPAVLALLRESYAQQPGLDVLQALVQLEAEDDPQAARQRYAQHLERTPSLIAASQWLSAEVFQQEGTHALVQRALDTATRPLRRFRCAACGFEAQQHFWQCPGCQAWDSYPPRRIEEL